MTSFKVKLVAYFLLLSLLPLAAAFWGFATVAARSETRRVDARLQAELRATLAAYQDELRAADAAAARVARRPDFQRALVQRDRAALERILGGDSRLSVRGPNGFLAGPQRSRRVATRQVAVVGPGGSRGVVIAAVPLDRGLVRQLEARAGLEREDYVVLLEHGRIVAGPPRVSGVLAPASGRPRTLSLGGTRYRALAAGTIEERPSATLGIVSPQASIDAANRAADERLLLGLLGSLLLVSFVAYVQGRAIVRTIRGLVRAARAIARGDLDQRVPAQGRDELALLGRTFNQMAHQLQMRVDELDAERARLRDVISRFGEALAVTHDPDQLRRVFVEAAVEATAASGGVLVSGDGDLVQAGYPDKGRDRLEIPLRAGKQDFGALMLFGDAFGPEDSVTATSLASHAAVALENARLHRIVERQALLDGLTGLANRRHCEEALAGELARVERFGGSVAIVVADLDDFKDVNDRFGHPSGDVVLREFAVLLREGLRDIDVAGRWGGEEFLLILPGTDLEGGALVAERVRQALATRIVLSVDGAPIPITASFGVAAAPPEATAAGLFAAADAALYEAKRSGKNRVEAAAAEPATS